jgi:tellurite resistance protein
MSRAGESSSPVRASFRSALARIVPSLAPAQKLSTLLAGGAEVDLLLTHRPELARVSGEALVILRFLVKMGQVDGKFDEKERAFVRSSMQELGYYATAEEITTIEHEVLNRRVVEIVDDWKAKTIDERERLLELGVLLAASSGGMASDERKALTDVMRALDIPRETYDRLVADALR